VDWLISGRGIPLQGAEPPPLQPEFSQPPLYYLAAAPLALLAGPLPANLPDWESQRNPFQDATDYGNVNLYLHLPREAFPWSGALLGLHLMRLVNVLFVTLMVLATYGCGIELRLPRALAWCAAALAGLVPQLLFLGGALNADNAVGSLSAASLYLLLRWLNRGPNPKLAVLLGLAIGAAALSKLSGLVAVALALSFMIFRTLQFRFARAKTGNGTAPAARSSASARRLRPENPRRLLRSASRASVPAVYLSAAGAQSKSPGQGQGCARRSVGARTDACFPAVLLAPGGRPALADVVLTAGSAALVAGWWYVRNWLELSDPLGWNAMLPATGSMLRQVPLDFGAAVQDLLAHWYTGLAVFGWTNLRVPWVWYWLFLVLGGWAIVGLVIGFRRAVAKRRLSLQHLLLVLWPLAFFVSLVRWVQVNTAADQWRLLFPAYPALALLAVFGLFELVRRKWQPLLAVPAALLALNVGALATTVLPAYAGPQVYEGGIDHPLDVRFGDALQLAGYSTPQPLDPKPGDAIQIDLYWRALAPIPRNYATDMAAIDAQSHLTWKELSAPDEGRAPMPAWPPGQIVRDRHRITARPEMVGSQTLLLSVIDPMPPGNHLRAATSTGQRLENDTATLGRFLILAAIPAPAVKDNVSFQDHLQLVGHSLVQTQGQLHVVLDWKATGSASKDYTVFVHMVAPNGDLVAQHDGQPAGGAFPTSLLAPGAEVPDPHVLDVSRLPAGKYQLEIGLYDLASGARLPTDRGDTSLTLPVTLTYADTR
jgi:hypothetical protein